MAIKVHVPLNVPAKTQEALANPAPPGNRHHQMTKIACALARQRFAEPAIQAQLRSMYSDDVTDGEIEKVVAWAFAQNLSPSTPPVRRRRRLRRNRQPGFCLSPVQQTEKFLQGFRCTAADLSSASPVQPPEDWTFASSLAISELYKPGEQVNIVKDFKEENDSNGEKKARPVGIGLTLERNEWLKKLKDSGTPKKDGGAWLRMNPVDGKGVADTNVTSFRFCLLESDSMPLELQLALYAKLRLPIAMLLFSGGKSVHAWVHVGAKDSPEYRAVVRRLLILLALFGLDDSNGNPSRLSRLPGAQRGIGAHGDGEQRLIYLNPNPESGRSIL